MGADVSFAQDVNVNCRTECKGDRGDQVICVGNGGCPPSETTATLFVDGELQSTLNHKLLKAAGDGDVDMLQLMLNQGAYVETRRPFVISPHAETRTKDVVATSRGTGMTPLMYAAQGGYTSACESLLKKNACVNAEDEDGTRPLHFAAGAASLETCQMLLQYGAEVAAHDDDGHGALEHVPPNEMATPAARQKWTVVLERVPPHADASVPQVESADMDNVQPPCTEAMEPVPPHADASVSQAGNADMDNVQHPPCAEAMEPVPPHADASVPQVESADMDNVQHPPCAEAVEPELSAAGPEQ